MDNFFIYWLNQYLGHLEVFKVMKNAVQNDLSLSKGHMIKNILVSQDII